MSTAEKETAETLVRGFTAADGSAWEAVALDAVVAHGKIGAVLAMRPAGDVAAEPLLTTVTFNSKAAAGFALRTLGVKELRRRLLLARAAAGGV